MESLRQALHDETAGVPPLGDIDRAINQVSTTRRRWAGVIGVAAAVLVLLVALVGPGWQPLAVEPAAPQPSPTATSSVMPDPAQPEPAAAVRLPMVDRVPVTLRQAGDLTYVADGTIVRRAPDGTATTWVPRGMLDDACGRPDCDILDIEWSPSGDQLAVVLGTIRRLSPSELGVYVISADSGSPRKVLECLPAMCGTLQGLAVSWSPDSSRLAVAGEQFGDGLVVVDADGPVADPSVLCNDCPAAAPAWSPDGRWIAYISSGEVRRVSAEGGPSELVATGSVESIAWSPDGTRLLIGDEDGVHVLDLSRRPYSATTIGEPLPPAEAGAEPAWSPDGERVSWFQTPQLKEGFHGEVWTASSDGSGPQRLIRSDCCVSDWTSPSWSPDGEVIVLGLGLDSTRPPDLIFLESGDGTEVERGEGVGWGPMSWQALP